MLVLISDIHLCDGTAFQGDIDPRAFRLLLSDVYDLAKSANRDPGKRRIDIALMGDVFDLLRTERWFTDKDGKEVPLSVRPWGSAQALTSPTHSEQTLAQGRAITAEIAAHNAAALRVLRGEDPQCQPPDGFTVRRIFVPGNHDRLYLHDAQIRAQVLGALGAVDGAGEDEQRDGIFPFRLQMPRYGLLARHGHEWDAWNFESFRDDAKPGDYSAQDHLFTPIGDPITTELVARLPYELRRRLSQTPAFQGTEELERVCGRLQRIEDVRPTLAAFQWIFYEAGRMGGQLPPAQAAALHDALSDTIATLAEDFLDLEFVRAWIDRHDVLGIDRADKLSYLLRALQKVVHLDFTVAFDIFSFASKVWSWIHQDPLQKGAAQEDLSAVNAASAPPPGERATVAVMQPLRFVVYGHTHEPLQLALRADATQDIYLNSGTWRDRQYASEDGHGFISWQTFSYLVFYDEDERQPAAGPLRRGPSYERWLGTRAR